MESEHPAKFWSKGTVLLNVRTGESRTIWERGHAIHWAEFSDTLLMLDFSATSKQGTPDVYSYSVQTQEMELCSFRDIRFSRGGTYYYVPLDQYRLYGEMSSGLYVRFELYHRESNQRVNPGEGVPLPPQLFTRLLPVMWIDDKNLACNACADRDWWKAGATYVLNVETGVLRKSSGRILGPATNDASVVSLRENGALAIESLQTMTRVEMESLPIPDNPAL
jgi:hypothetical protein